MSVYVLDFHEIDKTQIRVVGGKGANLGELWRIGGIRVPDGFCVTTHAFQRIMREASIGAYLDQLARLKLEDREQIGPLSAEMRRVIEGIAIPQEIEEEITRHLSRLGANDACAVRSSATAEDLPAASFAGQQDTYLNVVGVKAILAHIGKCWASLFTERAIVYRLQNGYDHRQVHLSVVVQKMVMAQVAGILFTADPVTSNRKVSSIDASFGLGEALVSGIVNADLYRLRNGALIEKKVPTKKLAVYASKDGGVQVREIGPEDQNRQALADEQILQLEGIGRAIEAHFGAPQDIEWCLADDTFYVVQSRPITTLFPIPEANDQENHVYISVGHNQMMTDAMKPLGLSFFLLTTSAPMRIAGGRLFVDITHQLTAPASRERLIDALGRSDPLIQDALLNLVGRGDFIKSPLHDEGEQSAHKGSRVISSSGFRTQVENDPTLVSDLIQSSQASIEALGQTIQTRSGSDLFDFIVEDIQELKKALSDPQNLGIILAAMDAAAWLNEKMMEWLGEKNAADTLSQSAPNNVTSEMGLALLDVADVIRPYPAIVEYLQGVEDDDFLNELVQFEGGEKVRDAISGYLDKYGMRCAGEIDITRTRWSEKPAILLPLILNHIKNLEPHAGKRRFEQGQEAALRKEQELLARLQQSADGEQKTAETKRMIDLLRNYIGYREYPKYGMVRRYGLYKQALLKEAGQLVQANVLHEKEDSYYLTFEELREVVRTHQVDNAVINRRKDEYRVYERLTPPRVITSDGEIIVGKYAWGTLPANALAGLPVSSGVVEGRARVILNMEDADLEDGDILVTPFTDPSWTPLFVSIKGLVTEVGGLMTHGAVIAREYGLPAVVGVENATRLIQDGQRIWVNGTDGIVELR